MITNLNERDLIYCIIIYEIQPKGWFSSCRNGAPKYTYEGENNKAGIVAFMKNPGKTPEKPKDEIWAETPSDVVHLTDTTFHEFIKVINSFFCISTPLSPTLHLLFIFNLLCFSHSLSHDLLFLWLSMW